MKSEKLLKIGIILSIIIIILLVIIINVIKPNGKSSKYEQIKGDGGPVNTSQSQNTTEKDNKTFKKVTEYNTYFLVKNILNEYVTYFENVNSDVTVEIGRRNITEKELKEQLYKEGILTINQNFDKQYKEEMQYDEAKIKDYVSKYKNTSGNERYRLNIEELYSTNIKNGYSLVLAYLKINNKPFNCMIKLDLNDKIYSIFWDDYIEKNGYNSKIEKEIKIEENIEKQDNNKFILVNTNDVFLASQHLDDLKYKMVNEPERLYNILDDNYKEKRFPNYTKFAEFLNEIKERINKIQISKYRIDGNKIQVLDNYNNVYTFKTSGIMEYTVLLDNYTIEENSITESYKKLSDENKVASNIQKLVKMINLKDYTNIYNLLDDNFKRNNYSTENELKTFIVNKLYNYNVIDEIKSVKKEGNYYIGSFTIKNGENVNFPEIELNIVMQLKEETDFVMSFSMK